MLWFIILEYLDPVEINRTGYQAARNPINITTKYINSKSCNCKSTGYAEITKEPSPGSVTNSKCI
jgi:hypothetical protein